MVMVSYAIVLIITNLAIYVIILVIRNMLRWLTIHLAAAKSLGDGYNPIHKEG